MPQTIDQITELENEDKVEEENNKEPPPGLEPKRNNLMGEEEESFKCTCKQRQKDEKEKEKIINEISVVSEDILQLEQSLIELDEQNTMNAIEISKREAKILLLKKQIDEHKGKENTQEDFDEESFNNHIEQHSNQIEILSESTKQNLLKRQSMKEQLFENYNKITNIRSSIHERIESNDVKEYLLLVIKTQFLESQNVQLLLNLQLQAKTISKYDKYFNNISQNGGIPDDMMEADDLLEEEEDEEAYSDNYEEEEKIESSTENNPSANSKRASKNDNSNISMNKGANNKSKIPKTTKGSNKNKSTLMNNPYFKNNPYIVQQSKKK